MKKFLILFLALAFSTQVFAQDEENIKIRPAIGLYGGLNFNMHSPDVPFFYYTQSATGINAFNSSYNESANSFGFNVGLIGLIPINDYVVIAPRVGYNTMNGLLKKDFSFPVNGVEVQTKNELTTKLAYLEITPAVQFHNLLPIKPLYFMLGFEVGLPMVSSWSNANDHNLQKQMTTTMPDTSIAADIKTRMALALGVGYTFELSDYVKLSAEVSYRLPFSDVTSFSEKLIFPQGGAWKVNQLRAGINLTFDIGGRTEPTPVPPPAVDGATLDMQMGSINAVTRDGQRTAMRSIRVEDQQYTELFPFVSYVFFDENSTNVAGGYEQLTRGNEAGGTFTISTLPADAIKINSNTLNIVGTRMQEYPNATVTITGTLDNKKERNKSLSGNRAAVAKDYLVNQYNISENRIKTVSAGLPNRPSSQINPDGIAENRRLEITSDDPRVTEPILITGDNIRIATPDVIEFSPVISASNATISSFKLDLFQSGKNIRTIRGDYEPTTIQWAIAPNDLANRDMPVEYSLVVRSEEANIEKEVKGSIPVEYLSITKKKQEELADKIVSRYSLTLFDFDKAEVSSEDMAIIEKYIVPAIKYNSTVDVYGYTDRIGDENYNMKLSQRRADAVKKILSSKVPDAKFISHGVGESVSIFDNDTPVGRHLSRTVQIYITTPR